MARRIKWLSLLMAAVMVITSCAPAATPTPVPQPTAVPPTAAPGATAAPPPTAAPVAFDWMKYKGKSINVILNKHPYSESAIALIPEFEAATGIKVTFEVLAESEYMSKIRLELASGQGLYDVLMAGPYHEWEYYRAGWLEPLEGYLNDPAKTDMANYKPEDFFPALMAANRWNGQVGSGVGQGSQWAIPVMVETYILPYRADLFAKYNLSEPKTLKEMVDAAITIRKGEGGDIYGFIARGGRGTATIGTGYMSAVWSAATTERVDFDIKDGKIVPVMNQPRVVEATDLWVKAVKEAGPPGWTSILWYDAKELFASGKYAMFPDCDFFADTYEDPTKSQVAGQVRYMPMPPFEEGGKSKSSLWAWSLAMCAQSKAKDPAWYFIQYMTSPEALLKGTLQYRNYNPTRLSVFNHPEVQAMMGSWGQGTYLPTMVNVLNNVAQLGWTPQPERTQVGDRWSVALHEIWAGTKTAQQAMDDAAADIQVIIDKAGIKPGAAPTMAPPTPAPAAFDWKQQSGKSINVILNKHPYSESIIPQIPAFTEKTGIKVTFEVLSEVEYFNKLKLELGSGQGLYDVFMTGPQVEWQYYPGKWLEPLETYLKDAKYTDMAWYKADDLFESLMAANRWNGYIGGGVGEGSQWAIPVMVEGDVLPYRADLFAKYNLPDPPVTLEDMVNAAITIRKGEGGDTYGIVARGQRGAGASGTGYTSIMASYNGGKPPDFEIVNGEFKSIVNKPELVAATELYIKAIREGGPPGWTSVQWFDGKELVATGKYAMYPDCDFFAQTYEDPTKSSVAGLMKYAPPPAAPGKDPASRVWTWALGMASASKQKVASWLFIQYMTSPEAMVKATLEYANYNPTRASVFEDPRVVAVMGKWGQGTYLPTVVEVYDKYLRMLSTPHPQGDEVSTRLDDALQEIWSGSKTAKQALDDAARDIDEIMRKAGIKPGQS